MMMMMSLLLVLPHWFGTTAAASAPFTHRHHHHHQSLATTAVFAVAASSVLQGLPCVLGLIVQRVSVSSTRQIHDAIATSTTTITTATTSTDNNNHPSRLSFTRAGLFPRRRGNGQEDSFGSKRSEESEQDEKEQEDTEGDDPFGNANIPNNRLINVTSQISLPFSAEIAYDAYSNLPRQPSWSSWLDSVVMSEDNPKESIWTLKFLGMSYSWTAEAVKNIRPHTIQWRSTSGLQNYGTVRFLEGKSGESTVMTMQMTFVAPRAISLLFNQSTTLTNFVEKKMVGDSLVQFRKVVLENDVKEKQQHY
jgi:uncharacterized membrane protein